jgi:hypothetical protein
MMVVVAQSDGGITERERVRHNTQMTKRFGAQPDQADSAFRPRPLGSPRIAATPRAFRR